MGFTKTSDTAYFMFGRFNPPTIGHGAIFKKLADDAKQDNADAFVFVSSTQNADKNPLSIDQKMYYIEKLYGNLGIHFINTTTCELGERRGPCTNPSFAVERLRSVGYDTLVLYVGSDRVEDFQWIRKSNLRKGLINPIQIVNRMPPRTANNFISSMSATKIRQAARNGNVQFVRNGTGLSEENARLLINQIRSVSAAIPAVLPAALPAATKSRKKQKPVTNVSQNEMVLTGGKKKKNSKRRTHRANKK